MRYPLVDGQGNFGSVDGDPPAAMRYTEARLRALAEETDGGSRQGDRRFRPELRRNTEEPTVLPAPFPNLLVNGSSGIAVGMATNIPPHNLREIIEAVIGLIDNVARTSPAKPSCATSDAPGSWTRFPDRRIHRGTQGHRRGVHRPAAAPS